MEISIDYIVLSKVEFRCKLLFEKEVKKLSSWTWWHLILSQQRKESKRLLLCSLNTSPCVCKKLRKGMWKTSSKISKIFMTKQAINDQREQRILESFYPIFTMCLSLRPAATAEIDHSCTPFIRSRCFIC